MYCTEKLLRYIASSISRPQFFIKKCIINWIWQHNWRYLEYLHTIFRITSLRSVICHFSICNLKFSRQIKTNQKRSEDEYDNGIRKSLEILSQLVKLPKWLGMLYVCVYKQSILKLQKNSRYLLYTLFWFITIYTRCLASKLIFQYSWKRCFFLNTPLFGAHHLVLWWIHDENEPLA